MYCKYKSDGLGGFFGVSCSLGLGAKKKVTYNKFHLLLFALLISMLHKPNVCGTPCLSLILALQRSNEMYKNIKVPYTRLFTSSRNIVFTRNCFIFLSIAVLSHWILALILLSGDIEINPGPDSVEGSTDSSHNNSTTSYEMFSNHLSIFHLNIQSIVPKMDMIRSEADAYDVLVFSESWLKPKVNNDSVSIENFLPPFRTDRCDRLGGGVVIYVRESLLCKRRTDLELHDL